MFLILIFMKLSWCPRTGRAYPWKNQAEDEYLQSIFPLKPFYP
ncbi:hypothetical protein IC582_022940 [Cucumis melo]